MPPYYRRAAAVALQREQLREISLGEEAGVAAHAAVGERRYVLRPLQPGVDEPCHGLTPEQRLVGRHEKRRRTGPHSLKSEPHSEARPALRLGIYHGYEAEFIRQLKSLFSRRHQCDGAKALRRYGKRRPAQEAHPAELGRELVRPEARGRTRRHQYAAYSNILQAPDLPPNLLSKVYAARAHRVKGRK